MIGFRAEASLWLRDRYSAAIRGVAAASRESSRKIKAAAAGIKAGWADVKNAGRGMSVSLAEDLGQVSDRVSGLARAFGGLADAPAEAAAGVQSALARLSTLPGVTEAALTEVRAAAERTAGGLSDAGQHVAIGVDEFVDAAYTAWSSGLSDWESATAAVDVAALLALPTGASAGDAQALLTQLYNTMGDRSADARTELTRLADVMVSTQQFFAFENLGQLGEGFKNVAGSAASFEVPLGQVSAALGVLNTMGIQGAEAGTALKSVLAQLAPASDKLGFSIAATAAGGVDLVGTLQNIAALDADPFKLGEALGTEAGPAVALMLERMGMLREGLGEISESNNVTAESAAKMGRTFEQSQARLSGAMSVWQASVGAGNIAVRQFGTELAAAGVTALNWVTTLPGAGPVLASVAGGATQVAASLSGVAAGALDASVGLLSTMTLLGPSSPLRTMGKPMLAFGKSIIALIPKIGAWAVAAWGAAAAHIAVAWPIYAVVAAVALLAAGVYLIIRNWDAVAAFFTGLWDNVKATFAAAWEWIAGIVPAAIKAVISAVFPLAKGVFLVIDNWDAVAAFFTDLWGGVKQTFTAAWGGITGIVGAAAQWVFDTWDAVAAFFTGLWGGVEQTFTAAWEGIAGIVGAAAQWMFDAVFAPFHAIEGFFKGIWDGVAGVFQAAWDKIAGVVQTAWDKISGFGGGVLVKLLDKAADIGGPLLAKVFGGAAQGSGAGAAELAGGMDRTITTGAAPYMPQSDAQRGPFSRLTAAGAAIPATMAAGVAAGAPQLGQALDQALPPAGGVEPRGAADLIAVRSGAPQLGQALDQALPPAVGGVEPRGAADLIDALRGLSRELRASREEHRDRGGDGGIRIGSVDLRLDASELWSLLEGLGGALGRSYG